MKILFAICLCVVMSFGAKSQLIVDQVDVNKLDHISFLRMSAVNKFMSSKVIIIINYGQPTKGTAKLGTPITDGDGKFKAFNSSVAAINYIESKGWQYIDSYFESFGQGNGVHHYHFRKK